MVANEFVGHEIPLLPSGSRVLVNTLPPAECAADIVLGGKIWQAAPEMCRWIQRNQSAFAGSSVLELGAGTGSCGLYCAGCGASRVVCTEGTADAPQLIELMTGSIQRNLATWLADGVVTVQRLDWGCDPELLPRGPFDWVIASDCVYDSDDYDLLCHTLRHVLVSSTEQGTSATRAILAIQHGIPSSHGWETELFADTTLHELQAAAHRHGLLIVGVVSQVNPMLQGVEELLFPKDDFEDGRVVLVEALLD